MDTARGVKRKAEELDDKFIKITTICSFCDISLLDNKDKIKHSRILECLHTVCSTCVESWDSDEKPCPKCDLLVHKSKLLDHKVLQELVETDEDPNKLNCAMHKTVIATHWCQQCGDYICEQCFGNHQRLKVTLDHEIIPKMDHWEHRQGSLQGSFPCSIHPKEQLVIFCTKCNVMTCRDCQLASHREHSYEFIEKVIDQAKTDIYDMYKFLTHHQLVLIKALDLSLDRKNKLLLRKDSLIREIHIFSTALMEIINKRSQYLITRLEQMTANKIDVFDKNAELLKKHLVPFDHTINFVDNVLHSSSDPSIIFFKDQIMSQMKKIHYQKSTIPNVVRNMQLKFSSGDITNLMKELQSFGSISMNDEEGCSAAMDKAAVNLSKQVRLALCKQHSAYPTTTAQPPALQQQSTPIVAETNKTTVSSTTFVQTAPYQSPAPRIQPIADAKIAFPVSQWTPLPQSQKGQVPNHQNRGMIGPPPTYPSRMVQPGSREPQLVALMNRPNHNQATSSQTISWHRPEPAQPINSSPSLTINKVSRLPVGSQDAGTVVPNCSTTVPSQEKPPTDTVPKTVSSLTFEEPETCSKTNDTEE